MLYVTYDVFLLNIYYCQPFSSVLKENKFLFNMKNISQPRNVNGSQPMKIPRDYDG